GVTLLRDYLRMSEELGRKIEKYPKSLKREHDIVMMNYSVRRDEIKNKQFIKKVTEEEYKSLEYKSGTYSVIAPVEMQDLINEGNELSHCISSYVDRVIKHDCKILFLRNTKEIDKPLVSLEIINNNIRQAR